MVLTDITFERMSYLVMSNDLLTWQIVGNIDCNDFSCIDKNNYSIFIVYTTIVLNLNRPTCWSIALLAFLFVFLTNVSEALQRVICDNPFKDSIETNDNLFLL